MYDLSFDEINLSKTKKHDIDIIVDRLVIKEGIRQRLTESIEIAMKFTDNLVTIDVIGDKLTTYSGNYSCPEHNIDLRNYHQDYFLLIIHMVHVKNVVE